ncbi:hypothetical protein [Winogradskyella arenosi]|nr:hypothetical protein [Winogradskyella arenosi]
MKKKIFSLMAVVMFASSLISMSPSTVTSIDDPTFNHDECSNEYDSRLLLARFVGFSNAQAHEMAGNAYQYCIDNVDLRAGGYWNYN